MKQNVLLILFPAMLVLSAGLASADTYSDDVVAQLSHQGFKAITKQSTWLGRMQIDAERADGHREIVLNPRTGEILRDEWTPVNGALHSKPIVDDVETSAGLTSGHDGQSGGDGSGSGSDSGSGSGDGSGTSGGSGSDGGSGGGSDDHDIGEGKDK